MTPLPDNSNIKYVTVDLLSMLCDRPEYRKYKALSKLVYYVESTLTYELKNIYVKQFQPM